MKAIVTILTALILAKIFYTLLKISVTPPGWGCIRKDRATKKKY